MVVRTTPRPGRRAFAVSRQDLVINLLDQAILISALYSETRKLHGDLPQEVAVFEAWDELADVYLAGLRQLRERAIAEVWPT